MTDSNPQSDGQPCPPGVEGRLAQIESALQRMAEYFSPAEEKKRVGRMRRAVAMGGSWVLALGGGAIGSWELISFLLERAEVNATANAYAEVAEQLYYSDNNPSGALKFVDQALEIRPNTPEYLQLRSFIEGARITKSLSNRDRPLTAEEVDDAFLAKGEADLLTVIAPNSAEGHFLGGQIYAALAEETDAFGFGSVDPIMADRSESALRRAAELDPDNAFVLVRLAQLEGARGNRASAIETVERALAVEADSKWALLWKGILRWQRYVMEEDPQDAEAARAAMERAIEIDPRFDLAWLNLATTRIHYPEFEDLPQARLELRRALSINPELHEALAALSYTWGLDNRYEVGLAYIDRAIELDPSRVQYRLDRAILLGELGRWAEGLSDLEAALALDPARIDIQQERAFVLREMARYGDAIRSIEFALELDPGNVDSLRYLAETYQQAGEHARAIEVVDEVLENRAALADTLGDTFALRARSQSAIGDPDAALADWTSAVESDPTAANLLGRGLAHRTLGNASAAIDDFRAAQRSEDAQREDLMEAFLADAALSESQGDLDAALTAIRGYLDMDPTDAEAKEIRDRLLRMMQD